MKTKKLPTKPVRTPSVRQLKPKANPPQLNEAERRYFKHFASPLELAAFDHDYRPFNYKFGDTFVYFSIYACKQLIDVTKVKASLVANRMDLERKSQNVPRRLREVFEDPTQVLSMPDYVRRHLCRLECYNMLRIMLAGRQFFLDRPEFGKRSMAAIEELFEKHRCEELFK